MPLLFVDHINYNERYLLNFIAGFTMNRYD
jgi:hypothetical protein